MLNQDRVEGGKFAPKSDKPRQVRSIRVTDDAWEKLGLIAESRCITRADLLEQIIEDGLLDQQQNKEDLLSEIENVSQKVLEDSAVTRGGKDKGAIKKGFAALLKLIK